MTSPNTIIADLVHEVERLQSSNRLLYAVAVRAELFISGFDPVATYKYPALDALLGDLRYAIEEAAK